MYTEFIIIFVALGVLFLMLAAALVLLILLLRRGGAGGYTPTQRMNNAPMQSAVVFCKRCATQFDANQRCCPRCGTPR